MNICLMIDSSQVLGAQAPPALSTTKALTNRELRPWGRRQNQYSRNSNFEWARDGGGLKKGREREREKGK